MNEPKSPNRCRIVLIAPPPGEPLDDDAARLQAALSGGDAASLIIPDYGQDETAFQDRVEKLTPLAQTAGAAVMIAGAARIAARAKADGIHVDGSVAELVETIEKYQSRMMIGSGGIKSRDDALQRGEAQPDYVFFGRFGYDAKPDPHPRNLGLAEWWSEMVQIPCIVLGGSTVASVQSVAASGADFVALSFAIFAGGGDPASLMAEANAILDKHASQPGEV